MKFEEAEEIAILVRKIKDLESLEFKIRQMRTNNEIDNIAETALQLRQSLLDERLNKIQSFPSLRD